MSVHAAHCRRLRARESATSTSGFESGPGSGDIMTEAVHASNSLLLEICNCPNIALAQYDKSHPCHKIVNVQDPEWDGFQLPEPWSGDLVNAPVLCIASNPSINPKEAYPNKIWSNELIVDFFNNRFSEDNIWTKERRVLLDDGESYETDSVNFWNGVHLQVERAFGREVVMGEDYVMTEIVHCKSKKEKGVRICMKTCAKMWMEKIIQSSSSRVLILFGVIARDWFGSFIGDSLGSAGVRFDVSIGGGHRTVVWLPHPSSGLKRILTEVLDNSDIEKIRRQLR